MKRLFLMMMLFFSIYSVFSLNLPELTGRVVDLTGTFSDSEKTGLETLLSKYENLSGNQLVVAMIDSLEGDSIEDYSISLAEKWKIGFKGKDNGIIILVAKNDHKMRIEAGYGLEGVVTDLESNLIINNIMKPYFQKNDFYSGVRAAIYQIGKLTGADLGQDTDLPEINNTSKKHDSGNVIIIIIVIIFIIFSFISNKARRRGYSIRGGRSNTFGGFGGFGGGSGSSGGGFSGGGGSFGGGGASGSW
jgi:uncharacterized protein